MNWTSNAKSQCRNTRNMKKQANITPAKASEGEVNMKNIKA
jgi:hypothetical protein